MERKTEPIYTPTVCFDGYLEESLDGEIRLADYYPDAQEILKIETPVFVTEGKISGDKVKIDGTLLFRVCYASQEGNRLGSVSLPLPFSKTFEAKKLLPTDGVAETTATVRYKNARLINARRISVAAAVGLSVTVKGKTAHEYLIPADGEFEYETKEITVGNYIGSSEREQKISEEFPLPEGKPNINLIVRYDTFATLTDVRTITNKAVLKGDVTLRLLYLTENNEPEHLEYSVPVTQILEREGLDEKTAIHAFFSVSQSRVEPLTGQNGETNAVKLEATVSAHLEGYERKQITVCTDAFSPQYDAELKKSRIPSTELIDTLTLEQPFRDTLEYSAGEVERICDLWGTVSAATVEQTADGFMVSAEVELTVLAYDRDGRLCSVDSTIPVKADIRLPDSENLRVTPLLVLSDISYTMTGENLIEVRGTVRVISRITKETSVEVIADILPSDTPKQSDRPPFAVYYASEGERVWDIAKAHNARVGDILRDNGLDGDIVRENRILRLFC